jgi:hypothetical protein
MRLTDDAIVALGEEAPSSSADLLAVRALAIGAETRMAARERLGSS